MAPTRLMARTLQQIDAFGKKRTVEVVLYQGLGKGRCFFCPVKAEKIKCLALTFESWQKPFLLVPCMFDCLAPHCQHLSRGASPRLTE